MKKTTALPVVVAVAVLAAAGITSWGQPSTPVVRYYWTPPQYGAPVDHYAVEAMIDSTVVPMPDAPDTTTTIPYQYGKTVSLRVAGVDSLGRVGLWSEWATPWTDDGPPSAPGTPKRTLEIQ